MLGAFGSLHCGFEDDFGHNSGIVLGVISFVSLLWAQNSVMPIAQFSKVVVCSNLSSFLLFAVGPGHSIMAGSLPVYFVTFEPIPV